MTIFAIIVAVSSNNVIGKDGKLPWKIKNDLKRFRELTMGFTVVMGRVTHESIGKPLKGRRNIVMSKTHKNIDGCEVAQSLGAVLRLVEGEEKVFFIGGSDIYKLFMPYCSKMYITHVHVTIKDGDSYFPRYDSFGWIRESKTIHPPDSDNEYWYTFETLRENDWICNM